MLKPHVGSGSTSQWARTIASGTDPHPFGAQPLSGYDFAPAAHTSDPDTDRAEAIADADLRLLADLVDQREALDARIRTLTCLYREWAQPPYPLSTLAKITRSSIAGVRTSYSDITRLTVEEITGVAPRTPRDPQRPTWTPGAPSAGQLFLGVDAEGNAVTVPANGGIAVNADPNRPDTRLIQRLIVHQIIDSHLPNWTQEADPARPNAVPLGEAIEFVLSLAGDSTNHLYGDVLDTFTRNGTRHRYSDVIPTFTDHQSRRLVHVVRSAALSDPPAAAILIGDLTAAAHAWKGAVPVISAAKRAHQWDWTLIPTGGGDPTAFRLAKADTSWVPRLLAAIQPELGISPPIAEGLVDLLRMVLER